MGGYLAFSINRIAPEFAAGFAFINTRAAADTQDSRRTRYEMVERARHEGTVFLQLTEPPLSPQTLVRHPEITEFARKMMADATPVGVMAAQRAMASRKDSVAQLSGIRVPTIVVYGVDDFIIPREEVEAMAAAIPDARFLPVADAGHLSPMDKPAEIAAAIRSVAQRAFA
jgi:3-oxoadipate enol-lactonase